jgi:plastocyanin
VYAVTQGVGGAFRAANATLPAAGSYDVAVTDLGFPVAFSELAAVVTQGATRLGSIFGGGSFRFTGVPGDVVINVLAQPGLISPAAAQRAGTYAVSVAATPLPTLTLSASATQVKSGDTVTLTWSSSDATTCTASGGWTGTRGVSGSEASAAIQSATTFTLNCTGDGGSTSQSVAVSVSASQNSGGGGALDALTLALLAGGVLACLRGRCRPAPAA